MKNGGLDPIGFPVVPTLIFDMTKAKALYELCTEAFKSLTLKIRHI